MWASVRVKTPAHRCTRSHFVATNTDRRIPLAFSARPITFSPSPPEWELPLSIRLIPDSIALFNIAALSSSSLQIRFYFLI